MLGWITLHRQLADHDLWLAEPFTRGQAWVDLLMLANHKDGCIRVRGNKIPVARGQVGWSQKRLAERWKWSRTKVRNFLDELENEEQQIVQHKNNTTSVITLVNFKKYQLERTAENTTERQQKDSRKTLTKNDKNDKNKKNTDNSNEPSGDRPKACPEEQWGKYLSYSRKFLESREAELGRLITVNDSSVTAGAKVLDNLIRVKGIPKKTVHETIEWAVEDDFWSMQVRSLGSLLKKNGGGDMKFNNILASRLREKRNAG